MPENQVRKHLLRGGRSSEGHEKVMKVMMGKSRRGWRSEGKGRAAAQGLGLWSLM